MQMLEIALFTTGGTIDGADLELGSVRSESSAAKWLAKQAGVDVSVRALFNKDSREVTENDRATLVDAIRNHRSKAIIVTHGTFTIAETGRVLKSQFGNSDKSILLVGSWIPFGSEDSDASEQMRFALETLLRGCAGVHIAMDGRLWNPAITSKQEYEPGKFRFIELPR